MKTISIIILTLITTSLYGQKISIGTELGVISSINSNYEVTDFNNRRNSPFIGLNLNYKFTPRLSFSTGILYLRQGYRHTTCYFFDEGVKNELVGKFDYLSMPITASLYWLKSRKLITNFGLLGSFNIQAAQDHPEPRGGCEFYYIPDLTASTQKYSISGIIGIGYTVFNNDKIEIASMIKYYQGLTNTYKSPYPDFQFNIDRKYSSALMTVNINYFL